jgi:transcriptional antiterminator NusG
MGDVHQLASTDGSVHEGEVTEVVAAHDVVDDDGNLVGEVLDDVTVHEVLDADGEVVGEVVEDHVVVVDAQGEVVGEAVSVTAVDADGEVLDEVVEVLDGRGPVGEDALGADVDDELDEDEEPEEKPESPFDRPGRWFVVHTYSGYENKVKGNLENIIKARELADRIHEIVVPMEDVVEFKNGKKVTVSKKVFPGYLLVRCTPSDDVWFAIRSSPGVTGFVGSASKPTPLSRKEVESILHVKAEGVEAPAKRSRPAHEFELNETVRIKEGPFADFPGHIAEINEDQLKVKVLVDIFGRETPVELEFSQVAKL